MQQQAYPVTDPLPHRRESRAVTGIGFMRRWRPYGTWVQQEAATVRRTLRPFPRPNPRLPGLISIL